MFGTGKGNSRIPGDFVLPLFLTNSPHSISVNYGGIFDILMSFHLNYCPYYSPHIFDWIHELVFIEWKGRSDVVDGMSTSCTLRQAPVVSSSLLERPTHLQRFFVFWNGCRA